MRRMWKDSEVIILKEMYPDHYASDIAERLHCKVGRIYNKALQLGLHKSEAFIQREKQIQITKLMEVGVKFRFQKGLVPHNIGKKMPEDVYDKIKHTMFQPGTRPPNAKPDGYEALRTDKGGRRYWMIKVPGISRMVYKHIYLYCTHHGVTLEQGQNIIFKDGNTQNVDIDNLQMITDTELMQRNTIQRYPDDIKQTIKLLAKLKKQIHAKEQN